MARFRQVHTSFWQDTFVLELTPEEKYFYIYLMTNSKTSASGVYELPVKIIELETGYNKDTVEKLLQKFISYGKIRYSADTCEILLVNWLKYNNFESQSTQKCIEKERSSIKNDDFREFITQILEGGQEGATTPPIDPRGDKEKDNDKDTDKEKDKKDVSRSASVSAPAQFNADYPPEFEEFWQTYPRERRKEKKAAYRAWKARVKAGAKPEQLIRAATLYAQECIGKETRYIKLPKTFLGPDCHWEDYQKPRGSPQPQFTHQHPVTDLQKVIRRKTMVGIEIEGGEEP